MNIYIISTLISVDINSISIKISLNINISMNINIISTPINSINIKISIVINISMNINIININISMEKNQSNICTDSTNAASKSMGSTGQSRSNDDGKIRIYSNSARRGTAMHFIARKLSRFLLFCFRVRRF